MLSTVRCGTESALDLPRESRYHRITRGDGEMELALNEINAAIINGQRFIVPSDFARQFGLAASNAAFRAANMDGYSKRGKVWFRD
jgi:hypothetical protein